jgi:ribosomal protein L25 (general stress protein Ctc)
MARSKRVRVQKKFLYFFLDDKLHKSLRVSRARDEIVAWCYPDERRVMYSYSLVNKHMKKAYSLKESAELLNKHKITIEDYILEGKIKKPNRAYPIGNKESKWSKYFLQDKDIFQIHQYIIEDGYSKNTPSKTELQALLSHNMILYTKSSDGKFIPVWKAE